MIQEFWKIYHNVTFLFIIFTCIYIYYILLNINIIIYLNLSAHILEEQYFNN